MDIKLPTIRPDEGALLNFDEVDVLYPGAIDAFATLVGQKTGTRHFIHSYEYTVDDETGKLLALYCSAQQVCSGMWWNEASNTWHLCM